MSEDPRIRVVAQWLAYNTKIDTYWDTEERAAEWLLRDLDLAAKGQWRSADETED